MVLLSVYIACRFYSLWDFVFSSGRTLYIGLLYNVYNKLTNFMLCMNVFEFESSLCERAKDLFAFSSSFFPSLIFLHKSYLRIHKYIDKDYCNLKYKVIILVQWSCYNHDSPYLRQGQKASLPVINSTFSILKRSSCLLQRVCLSLSFSAHSHAMHPDVGCRAMKSKE